MPTVFLSYRRDDTGGEAGRLADTFLQKLGRALAFRAVASIPLGAQFDATLEKELAAAKIVLVLIGPEWLAEPGKGCSTRDRLPAVSGRALAKANGNSRSAQGASLPSEQDLPEDLGSLVKHQAMTLRDES
jgi:hypothetical protein